MKSSCVKQFQIISVLLLSILIVFFASTVVAETINTAPPTDMIVDETQWEEWSASEKCKLFPFMSAGKQAGFTFSIPSGQSDSSHKTCTFVFVGGDKDNTSLKKAEMYYCVVDQTILYLGLCTEDKNIFESEEFKEACIRLMLGYNIGFDSKTGHAILNLSRERAEKVVDYCLSNVEHCLVDNMRIRVIRDEEDDYFSFHMEY